MVGRSSFDPHHCPFWVIMGALSKNLSAKIWLGNASCSVIRYASRCGSALYSSTTISYYLQPPQLCLAEIARRCAGPALDEVRRHSLLPGKSRTDPSASAGGG
jgi:hypothetical protein